MRNLEQGSTQNSEQNYMLDQIAVITFETKQVSFIEETKEALGLDREPTQNELMTYWIENNSARFREDEVWRNEKIQQIKTA